MPNPFDSIGSVDVADPLNTALGRKVPEFLSLYRSSINRPADIVLEPVVINRPGTIQLRRRSLPYSRYWLDRSVFLPSEIKILMRA